MSSITAWHEVITDKDGKVTSDEISISGAIKISDCEDIISLDMYAHGERGSDKLRKGIEERREKVETIIEAMNLVLEFYDEYEDVFMDPESELEYVDEDRD